MKLYNMLQLDINIGITMPSCPCHILSLDIVDVTGVHVVNVEGRLFKHRLDQNGVTLSTKDAVYLYMIIKLMYRWKNWVKN